MVLQDVPPFHGGPKTHQVQVEVVEVHGTWWVVDVVDVAVGGGGGGRIKQLDLIDLLSRSTQGTHPSDRLDAEVIVGGRHRRANPISYPCRWDGATLSWPSCSRAKRSRFEETRLLSQRLRGTYQLF